MRRGRSPATRRGWLPWVLLALALMPAPAAAAGGSSVPRAAADAARRGDAAYEAGRFAEAAAAYREAAAAGAMDENLYYNLGCAEARQQHWGQAILSFRRALWLAPRDEDAQANLAFCRTHLSDAAPKEEGAGPLLARLLALAPLEGALVAALIAEGAGSLALAAFLLFAPLRRPGLARLGAGLLLIGLALAAPAVGRLALRGAESGAVVLAERVEARSGPGDSSPVLFTAHEGFEMRLSGAKGRWVRVRTAEGLVGWLPRETIGTVRPGQLHR